MHYAAIRGHHSGLGAGVGESGVQGQGYRVCRGCFSAFLARGYKNCLVTRGLQTGAPLLVRNWMRKWCTGHLFVRVVQQLFFWTQENFTQSGLLLCLAPRRVHFARPWTQASKPALTDSSPAAEKRAEVLHGDLLVR